MITDITNWTPLSPITIINPSFLSLCMNKILWTLKFTNISLKNPSDAFPLMWDNISRISWRFVPVNMVAFVYYSRYQFHVRCQQEEDCHGIHLYQYVHLVGGTRYTYGLSKCSFWDGCWQVREGNKVICTNESSQPLTDMTVLNAAKNDRKKVKC